MKRDKCANMSMMGSESQRKYERKKERGKIRKGKLDAIGAYLSLPEKPENQRQTIS